MNEAYEAKTQDAVHISFLLDRSGSMGSIRDDVIGGFNQFLREQQQRPGACRMTVVQFDSQDPFEILADATEVKALAPLDGARYVPRGGTPLLDAIGALIEHAERRARGRDEDAVVVVFTDGAENESEKWTRAALFERIEGLKARGWAFVFLGANQDSYDEAGRIGFTAGSTSNWNGAAPDAAFTQISRSLSAFRSKGRVLRRSQSPDFFEGVKEAEQQTPPAPPRGKMPPRH
jgi:Mg-chelatase subunit ChlD